MTKQDPLVSIGVPVRNGARFLGEALDSWRAQTFRDFELIVSDNASTDDTREVIQDAQARDPRVRSILQERNLGAAANFNTVFTAARGRYFCWAAHDDLWSSEFLARCIEVLESDGEAILCFAGCAEFDETGRETRRLNPRPDLGSDLAHVRFRDVVQQATVRPIFGLVRADVLRRTRLMQPHVGSDRALLAELALRGRFREIPQTLFFSRQHSERYARATSNRSDRIRWWAPDAAGLDVLLPNWIRLVDYRRAIRRVPLPRDERRRCWAELLVEVRRRWRPLLHDLGVVGRELVSPRASRLPERASSRRG